MEYRYAEHVELTRPSSPKDADLYLGKNKKKTVAFLPGIELYYPANACDLILSHFAVRLS